MSSDLARLKQQLNKIMNQADKYSNNTTISTTYVDKNATKFQLHNNKNNN